ncbi:MAG: DNA polymerase III subunit beta [Solirubrobacteraceae bacterium]
MPTASLSDRLQAPAHIASARSGLAAIGGVLVTARDGSATLAATDLDMSIRVPLDGLVEGDGAVVVPARLLLDVVRMAPGPDVTCTVSAAGDSLEVRSGSSTVSLRALRTDDFPTLPLGEADGGLTLPGATLTGAIGQVARAASRDETRPLLTGVLVTAQGRSLRLVATDSYRLAVREVPLDGELPDSFEATVPARALSEAGRLAQQGAAEEITVAVDGNQVVFKVGTTILTSRLLEGHFPDYRQLLPESPEHELQFATTELLDVVRRVSLVAQKNTPLSLVLRDGEMTVSAKTPEVGEASETIAADFHGEGFEIGFNPLYLRDGLESVEAPSATLKLVSPLRPGVIEAGGLEGGSFTYLVMPVRLGA